MMKRPYKIGWFRDPFVDEGVVLVTRIFDGAWFATHYDCIDGKPIAAGVVLTSSLWKRLVPCN